MKLRGDLKRTTRANRIVTFVWLAALVTAALEGAMLFLPAQWSPVAEAHVQTVEINVPIPQIDLVELIDNDEAGAFDGAVAVNDAIREKALAMLLELAPIGNVWGDYAVHVARPDLLSLTMSYSGYLRPMAHPMHYRAAVTADPVTGRVYSLADLFVDEGYVDVLSEAVALGIEAQEVPLLVVFERIAPDQEYYLTESHLVLYYQVYELAPYAWGFPEFEIPLESLRSIAKEDGPIAALLAAE